MSVVSVAIVKIVAVSMPTSTMSAVTVFFTTDYWAMTNIGLQLLKGSRRNIAFL
jgi:hypothetical protein